MMQRKSFALIFILGLWLGLPWVAAAETVYVSDDFEITLRTGPGNEYRILAMLHSGTPLELLEEAEDWARVQAAGGKEGWVRKQHISRDLPREKVIERLQRENERLRDTAAKASEKAQTLGNENRQLSATLSGAQGELSGIKQQYASLSSDAANVVELKSRFEKTTKELQTVAAEKEKLATENQALRSEARMRWFLAGAGVVGGSWLIGFLMGRLQRRNRRSSLYS